MSEAAIRVENLGKMYRIGGPVERYKTLRDNLSGAVAGIGRRVRGWFGGENGYKGKYEAIWALKDVTFEVQPGEVVGVIGRNGAGKSTLLKILSRITEPTTGRVEIRGRVGSLLEVGTGFHPELTGRENVYLNGAILGMKRAEVDRKFDEIVAFAEVEKFIDTPVKHYSSGMYVRLAFSVAAHLDTDILLVDEVLAVGDNAFQKKCMGKIQGVTRGGKTVMLVSHNMASVQAICEKAIVLAGGGISFFGECAEAVTKYLRATIERSRSALEARLDRGGRGLTRFVEATADGGREDEPIRGGGVLRVRLRISEWMEGLQCRMTIYDVQGLPVFSTGTEYGGRDVECADVKGLWFECVIPNLYLQPGDYTANAALYRFGELEDHVQGVIMFTVEPGVIGGRAQAGPSRYGSLSLPHWWRVY
jgi:lipopolysaccharide transport system ATP-binding protein